METVYVNNGIKCLNKDARAKRKAFVQVTIEVDVEGNIYPQTIRWQDGRIFEVERTKQVKKIPTLSRYGFAMRYSIVVKGQDTYLWEEGGRWFVEAYER